MSGRVKNYSAVESQYLVDNAQLLSAQEMADHLGRTVSSVRSYLTRRSIPTRKDTYSREDVVYIIEWAGRKSWVQIGKDLNKSSDGIKTWASRRGIAGSQTHSSASSLFGTATCAGLFCEVLYTKNREWQLFCSQPCEQRISRLRKYSLSKERFMEMWLEQDGKCAISGHFLHYESRTGLAIDHDHSCCPSGRSCGLCIRGLLCGNCNHLLGKAEDDIEVLQEAIRYLKRTMADSKER